MLSVAAILFGLGVIVFFHEMGHLIMAKIVGLSVPRFSIGFPPHLFRKKIGETEYCIGLIPLGGYCRVNLGTSGEPADSVAWYRRALVALAGPLANLVLTALILILIFGVVGWDVAVYPAVVGSDSNTLGLSAGDTVLAVDGVQIADYQQMTAEFDLSPSGTMLVGTPGGRISVDYTLAEGSVPFQPLIPAVIGESVIGMPAYESGIRAGDSVVMVDGEPVELWSEFQEIVAGSTSEMEIVFYREGLPDTAYVTAQEYDGRILTGVTVSLPSRRIKLPPITAVVEGFKAAGNGVVDVLGILGRLIQRPGELVESSGGPVYVAETLGQQARTGLPSYLWTIASISIAIMIFNLLPIPVLDGGHIIILITEGIRGRPLSSKHIRFIQQAGMIIILTLFVMIMFKDISRVITRVR